MMWDVAEEIIKRYEAKLQEASDNDKPGLYRELGRQIIILWRKSLEDEDPELPF